MNTIASVDPGTGLDGGVVIETELAELELVLAAADRAAPELARLTPEQRSDALHSIADELESARAELVALADRETRLGPARLESELSRTTDQLRFYGGCATDRAYLDVTIDTARFVDGTATTPDLRRTSVPLGPVLVFAASNFPFAFSVAGTDTASALSVGCPVIVKANPAHPMLSARVAEIVSSGLAATAAPDGSFDVIHGVAAGVCALRDRRIRAAAFTGSLAGGMALWRATAERPDPIPFFGELGSLNPIVITREAAAVRSSQIANGFVESFTLGTGQFCTKPGVIFVPSGCGLENEIARVVASRAPALMLSPSIRERYRRTREELLAETPVEVLASGVAANDEQSGTWESPQLLQASATEVLADPERVLTECFGPSTLLVPWADRAELSRLLAAMPGSLTATLHCEPNEEGLPGLINELSAQVGRVIINGWPTGVAVTWAQHHGGPFPATTNPKYTSVGAAALDRFVRPIAFQEMPNSLLPIELMDRNVMGIERKINGILGRHDVVR